MALSNTLSRAAKKAVKSSVAQRALSTSFLENIGSHQFDDTKMQSSLTSETYNAYKTSIADGTPLSKPVRDEIASAMATFASSLGATTYCHKFYPLRYHDGRANAGGKMDTFVDLDFGHPNTLKPILGGPSTFNGSKLFFNETDGSSFPNGGMRATHTAGAYMSWDKTSPPYVRDNTLFIPSAFVTYEGDALDHKTPLLRSQEAINREGMRLLRHLGDTSATQVVSNVGCEQEYFLVDRDHFANRPDLVMTGRMLFGSVSEREQEGCEQYFGPPNPRAAAFMRAITEEFLKVGISCVVNHNEVAPSQHELSPIFSLTNVAADQNILTMEIMDDIAAEHGLKCLFHEKPFAGVNGTGKHNNWGLNTDTGKNLFAPGKTEETQTDFVASVAALAYAIRNHGDVLRAGVSCTGNDHRLGAQEAPPAILSLYTGVHLETHLRNVMDNGGDLHGYDPRTGVKMLPFGTTAVENVPAAMEDRNRTAPFPFCGNRFEFRAVGGTQNIGLPLAMLNTAVSDGFAVLSDKIEGGLKPRDAVAEILKENFEVIFNGDGYSAEWPIEAEKRGLMNLPTAAKALSILNSEKNQTLFDKAGVLKPHELEARQDILSGEVANMLLIEANTSLRMAETGFIPAFVADLASYNEAGFDAGERPEKYASVQAAATNLKAAVDSYPDEASAVDQAAYSTESLRPAMEALRAATDESERLCNKNLLPYPGYAEVLFDHQSEPSWKA